MTMRNQTTTTTQRPARRLMNSVSTAGIVLGLGWCLGVTTAGAETLGPVTLQAIEGNAQIHGELLEYDGETYVVQSSVGTVRIASDAVRCIGDPCTRNVEPVAEVQSARSVILKANDDGTEIRGELVEFDGRAFVIRTFLGEFRVMSSLVECEGAACPGIDTRTPQFAVYSSNAEARALLAEMWRGYAEEMGHSYRPAPDNGTPEVIRLLDAGDQLVAEISIKHADEKGAAKALSGGKAELAVVHRELEVADAKSAGLDLGESSHTLLGHDGLVVVTSGEIPVRAITTDEMRRIWSGKLKSWKSLGGGDYPITLHVVEERVAQAPNSLVKLARYPSEKPGDVVRHDSEASVIAAVKADRNAMGVVHRTAAVTADATMLGIRKVCGLTALPTDFDMQIEHYPMTIPIHAYGKGSGMHPVAASFMEWAETDGARRHVSAAGYSSAGLKRMKIQDMGMALIHTAAVEPDFDGAEFASMMQELRYADRLSITFRFLPGSSTLDEASIESMKGLAKRLRTREFDGQEILLVGFADSVGPADRNSA
ncbi:MAG: substrate-binding domain-containing protein, partial [Pseudomonadota bacterium]